MTREEMYENLDALYEQIDKTKARAEMAKNEKMEKMRRGFRRSGQRCCGQGEHTPGGRKEQEQAERPDAEAADGP